VCATRAIITQESLFSLTIVPKKQMGMRDKVSKIARKLNRLKNLIKRKANKVSLFCF